MVTKCVVPNCGNSCSTKLSVTLFSFPKDSKLAETWLQLTRTRRVKEIKSHHKVCSKHFEDRYILNHFGATRLAPGAVPTIFEWNSPNKHKTDVDSLIQNNSRFLTITNIGNSGTLTSAHRLILPKSSGPVTSSPKVRIPPLVKRQGLRAPLPKEVSSKSSNRKPLSCDVILPNRGSSNSGKLPVIVSSYSLYETNESPSHDGDEINQSLFASDDDRDSTASEFILGEIGDYTLSTKKGKTEQMQDEEYIDNRLAAGQFSDDDSHQPIGVDCVEGLKYLGSSLIEDIDPNHEDTEGDVVTRDVEVGQGCGEEIIIEECSIIEDEIIPPEDVGIPLSPSFFHYDDIDSPATDCLTKNSNFDELTKDLIETVPTSTPTITTVSPTKTSDQSNRTVGSVEKPRAQRHPKHGKQPRMANKAKAPQTPVGTSSNSGAIAMPPSTTTSTSTNPISIAPKASPVTTYVISQSGAQPAPLVPTFTFANSNRQPYQLNTIGGVTQPGMASFLIATAPSTPLLAAPSNVNNVKQVSLLGAPMTYLIPIGTLPPPLAVMTPSSSDTDKLLISSSKNNVNVSPRQSGISNPGANSIRRRKLPQISRIDGKKTSSVKKLPIKGDHEKAASTVGNKGMIDQRLFQQLKNVKIALKKKDLTVKRLKKEKNSLSLKLQVLSRALSKLRKATILGLSSAKFLEETVSCELASTVHLLLKETEGEEGQKGTNELSRFVNQFHLLSKRIHNYIKNGHLQEPIKS